MFTSVFREELLSIVGLYGRTCRLSPIQDQKKQGSRGLLSLPVVHAAQWEGVDGMCLSE
jgi:hypothetical protein